MLTNKHSKFQFDFSLLRYYLAKKGYLQQRRSLIDNRFADLIVPFCFRQWRLTSSAKTLNIDTQNFDIHIISHIKPRSKSQPHQLQAPT